MRELIEQFEFSPDASYFILMVWDMIQFFDDVFDQGPMTEDRIYGAVSDALVKLPTSRYYQSHIGTFAPAIVVAIEKWKMANAVESLRMGDAKSFMWRAAFYDILALVCVLEGKNIQSALLLYGENFEEYLQEVNSHA